MKFGGRWLNVGIFLFCSVALATPEQEWLAKRNPVVPTTVRWDAHYSGQPDDVQKEILDGLEASLARMLAFAPRSHLFAWRSNVLSGRTIEFHLAHAGVDQTDEDADIDVDLQPDGSWKLTVKLWVDRFSDLPLAEEKAARTDAAINFIFLALIPQFLATHDRQLAQFETDPAQLRAFQDYVRQRFIQAISRVLMGHEKIAPAVAQTRIFHALLRHQRSQVLHAREDIAPTAYFVGQSERGFAMGIPWDITDEEGAELGQLAERALNLVAAYPPPSQTNSPFSWDPADWAWTREVRVELQVGESPDPNINGLWESVSRVVDKLRHTPLLAMVDGVPHTLALNRPNAVPGQLSHRVVGLVPFEPNFGEAPDKLKADRFARLVAAFGGEVYGPMTEMMEAAARGERNRRFNSAQRIVNHRLLARSHAIDLLDRLLADPAFTDETPATEVDDIRRVRDEYRQWWFDRFQAQYEPGAPCVITIVEYEGEAGQ